MMAGFYELQSTNYEPRPFLGLRCGVPPRQTQTNNDASGNPLRVAGAPRVAPTMRLRRVKFILRPCPICHKFRLSPRFTRDALTGRPLRYRIEAMIIISRPLFAGGRLQKNTAYGLVRRGFHVGRPLERFRHSLAEYDGGSLRTTSYGLFSDSDVASPL